MAEVKQPRLEIEKADDEADDLSFVDGELLKEASDDEMIVKGQSSAVRIEAVSHSRDTTYYIFLPLLFLTVALFGGLRLNAADNAFVFLKPPLICLIFAGILVMLFFRAKLLRLEGWFSEDFSTLKNAANAAVLLSLCAASTQIFNSLLPERGLPFWIVAFCFFWTLWNNLFAEFDTKKLLQSLGGLFGLAFVVKYLVLANLVAPTSSSWWQAIIANPTQEAFTWLLDLPRFSAGTGYIQFFAVIFYLLGLFLLPSAIKKD
ncbi:MAG: hypothetical protein M3T96_10595 [Acidobacteriota bacterium]|nr:hypothetical protein [Acidobacteriota bacterium]